MKFQLLEHVVKDLCLDQSMEYLHVRLYVATHKSLEKAYEKTSEKHEVVGQDGIRQEVLSVHEQQKKKKTTLAQNSRERHRSWDLQNMMERIL